MKNKKGIDQAELTKSEDTRQSDTMNNANVQLPGNAKMEDVKHPESVKMEGDQYPDSVKMGAVQHPQGTQHGNDQSPESVKMEGVQLPGSAKTEIVYNLEKEKKSYIFYGEPDSRAPAVEFRHVLEPGGEGPPPHIHTKQTETFHVVSGIMVASVKGQEDVTLGPGEKIAVPPGIVHSFTNGNKDEKLVLHIVLEPALDFQWFMTEAVKSGIRNGGTQKNMPLLEAGHLMWLSRDEQRIGGLPYFLQDILFGLLSILARITGKAGNIASKP